MNDWSRPKKVISILVVFLLIFTGAYVIRNNDIFSNGNQNDDFSQVIKYRDDFYMKYMNSQNNPRMGGGNGCILKISDNGSSYKTLLNKMPDCFTIGDKHIYYTEGLDAKGIYKIDTDGRYKKKIINENAILMKYNTGWLYYINSNESNSSGNYSLYRVKTNGSCKEKLMSAVGRYVFYKNKIYFTRFGSYNILEKMDYNGKNCKVVCKIEGGVFQIKDDHIYTVCGGDLKGAPSDGNGMYLYRQRLDGSDKKKIIKEAIYYYGIYKNKIYYTTVNNKFYVADLNFKSSKLLKSECTFIVCADSKKIYIYGNIRSGLFSMNYNGKNIKKIFDFGKVKIKSVD